MLQQIVIIAIRVHNIFSFVKKTKCDRQRIKGCDARERSRMQESERYPLLRYAHRYTNCFILPKGRV